MKTGKDLTKLVKSEEISPEEGDKTKGVDVSRPRRAEAEDPIGKAPLERAWAEKTLREQAWHVRTEEQRRIGQDLHDGIGQELTGLSYVAANLEQRLQALGLPEKEKASQLAEGIRNTLNHIRMIAKDLLPPELDRHGIVPALRDLAREVTELHGIACRVEDDPTIHVPSQETAVHLYRLVQEAVNNAVKHAEARTVVIEIRRQTTSLCFTVRDDGKGICIDIDKASTTGLRTMNYRADIIGADLQIHRGENGGTVVTCTFPAERHHGEDDV